jgi:hypothetical protein
MTTNMSKFWIAGACLAAALAALGCGGRTVEGKESDATDVPGSGTQPDTPAPTCGDICRRAVDICFPGGAIDQCVRDCEQMRSDYQGCRSLDTFLRCRIKAPVLCTDRVTFDGCYDEINAVTRCKA